jgi:hypothetical protein
LIPGGYSAVQTASAPARWTQWDAKHAEDERESSEASFGGPKVTFQDFSTGVRFLMFRWFGILLGQLHDLEAAVLLSLTVLKHRHFTADDDGLMDAASLTRV